MTEAPAHPDYLSYRVKRLYLLISQRIDDALKPHCLARSQWQVLARVPARCTLTQKDLQHAMQVESATLTGIIDVLETRGWLERLGDPSDKRLRVLRLTDEGMERLATVPDPFEIVERRMLEGIDRSERARMEGLLEAMIAALEERKPAGTQ